MRFNKVYAATLAFACLATGCNYFGPKKQTINNMTLSKSQEAKLCVTDKITTLDPRLTRGLAAGNVTRMLFEGLTYVDENGKIFPGIAQNIHISPDLKTFTFTLRDCNWSN